MYLYSGRRTRPTEKKRRRLEKSKGHLFRRNVRNWSLCLQLPTPSPRHLRVLRSFSPSPRIRLQRRAYNHPPGPSIKYNCLANSYRRRGTVMALEPLLRCCLLSDYRQIEQVAKREERANLKGPRDVKKKKRKRNACNASALKTGEIFCYAKRRILFILLRRAINLNCH